MNKVEAHARSVRQARIAFRVRHMQTHYDLAHETEAVHRGDPQSAMERHLFWGLAIAVQDDAVWDAIAQVRQGVILSRELDVDVQLGEESRSFPQRPDCPRPLLEAVAAFCGGRVVETPEGEP